MDEVRLDLQGPTGEWVLAGSVSEVEPPGSLSSEEPLRRRVLLFGWYEGHPGVWESQSGADAANEAVREIATLGLTRLADLTEGPYLLDIFRGGTRLPVRFTLVPAPGDGA